jgi:hypothetical protein
LYRTKCNSRFICLSYTSPFYESKDGKIIGQRIVSTGNGTTPQIEVSVIENGTMKGVGNVTSLGTWTNTFRSRINYGFGQGVITTADGQDMATWTGYGNLDWIWCWKIISRK